jgi:uncharacterized RDD family membrane protein YckC
MARVEDLMARGVLPAEWSPAAARNYAGFWRRVGASLVDTLIFLPVTLIFGFALTGTIPELIHSLFWIAYAVPMDARGGTLGKKALGIGVVDGADQAPGLERSVRRHVWDFAFLPLAFVNLEDDPSGLAATIWIVMGLVAFLDILWMLWDDDRQTLHDKLAGTYVVRSA